ncbi:hypothetical protein [Aeromonas phage Akh-2]|nr:hypothetical protein [Aeromonas phage Akh-2]
MCKFGTYVSIYSKSTSILGSSILISISGCYKYTTFVLPCSRSIKYLTKYSRHLVT